MKREYCDWRQPPLATAAQFVLERFAGRDAADLGAVTVAVTGGRAARRLLEMLVIETERRDLAFVPPRIVTVGVLPELFYEAKKPFADEFTQALAWVEALQQTDPRELTGLVRVLPPVRNLSAWLPLAHLLSALHTELAADGLDFSAVLDHSDLLPSARERERWVLLARVQQRYLCVLDDLELWDRQTARRFAIEHHECVAPGPVVLVGLVDLPRAVRALLDQAGDAVTALVFAPPELQAAFDEHGCVRPAEWMARRVTLNVSQMEVVDSPGDQADAVVRALARLEGRYAAEEITIGVPDAQLVPFLQQRLTEAELPHRYGPGTPVTQTALYRLLAALAEFLEEPRFADFAALLRHPMIDGWLFRHGVRGFWLAELDAYQSQRMPLCWTGAGLDGTEDFRVLPQVNEALAGLTIPLLGPARELGAWSQPVMHFIHKVLGDDPLNLDREPERHTAAVLGTVRDILRRHQDIDARLMPECSSAEALRFVLRGLESEIVPARQAQAAIELLGWLELPLDDAPVLVVTGFNEGVVPSSRNGDLFLPNELRKALRLDDNDRRYARDAYALSLIIANRAVLHVIAGRRSVDRDPLIPSRLLFACGIDELPSRVLQLMRDRPTSAGRLQLPGSLRPGDEAAALQVPPPQPLRVPVATMRVTEFRDFLACPYRYYLRHRLKLRTSEDSAEELAPNDFGSLLHEVLRRFGESDLRDSADTDRLRTFLDESLDSIVAERFLTERHPAIALQVEQVRLRLHSFASWQTEWRRDGWRIHAVELEYAEGLAGLTVDGMRMGLNGRIDRIDVHRDGRVAVLDYKTGDSAVAPDKTHRVRDRWIDLQLPLYRHLVTDLELGNQVELGYVLLPRQKFRTGEAMATWTPEDLRTADEVAADVIRAVRAEQFVPRAKVAPAFTEEFAAICQDGAQPADDEDDSEDEELAP